MTMPVHFAYRECEDDSYNPLESAALTAWGDYWLRNQDSSVSIFPRVNHICSERSTGGDGLEYVQLMPVGVEYVDCAIARLSWPVRLAVWEWWVVNRQLSLTGCAEGVRGRLKRTCCVQSRYNRNRLQIDLAVAVGTVGGMLAGVRLGDPADEDCSDWWCVD